MGIFKEIDRSWPEIQAYSRTELHFSCGPQRFRLTSEPELI
jgi:hypothetical protein